jgi:hypothetical protein
MCVYVWQYTSISYLLECAYSFYKDANTTFYEVTLHLIYLCSIEGDSLPHMYNFFSTLKHNTQEVGETIMEQWNGRTTLVMMEEFVLVVSCCHSFLISRSQNKC